MNALQKSVILLIKSAISNKELEIPETNFSEVLTVAGRHHIINIIYLGVLISKIKITNEELNNLKTAAYRNLVIDKQQIFALQKIYEAFEENEIDYMPVKGSVVKYLYKATDMRQMTDSDILIKTQQYDKIHKVMTELGYVKTIESDHEIVFDKPNYLHLELHKSLIPSYNKDHYKYYGDGWDWALKSDDSSHRYVMSTEDTFIYLFTHFAKHYRDGGIGIKHMIDLYIYKNIHKDMDYKYIEEEFTKLNLLQFYKNVIMSLTVWFEDVSPNEITDCITGRVFYSGAYGKRTDHVVSAAYKQANQKKSFTRIRKIQLLRRVFPNYSSMAACYPWLRKCRILLPVGWVLHWFEVLFFRRKSISTAFTEFSETNSKALINYKKELNFVGLDFNE